MSNHDLLKLLGELERLEAVLLTWGFVDAGFTEGEVTAKACEVLDLAEDQAEEILEDLIDAKLLFRIRLGRRLVYRTRSAETIRLLVRLRQLFPPHLISGNWRHAPTLVSDFRYSLRPRTYPDRTIAAESAVETLAAGRLAIARQAIEILLQDRGGAFRLAPFQVTAATRILNDLEGRSSRGTIIGAGTGSGKTLAFYLPALAHVASRIDRQAWTKAIAVYPRNELLKDQFSETFVEARRLDGVLVQAAGRKLTIGAFFGPTPQSAQSLLSRPVWEHIANGFICPYLRCPVCGGDLAWSDEDVRADRECLRCTKSGCGLLVPEDEVVLTRGRMRRDPPDLLFTTTEMLNRQLADSSNAHVFGVGSRAAKKPELMLLDEVHTYEGTTGAQVAYVIRRWRHAVGSPVQFVGLSATLREAQTFFADLVGLADHAVASIIPSESELISEGMEYLLALRGDPVSGTSLLSTTIQAAMLLRRTLEPEISSESPYGSRLFLFTDDLDVTNRLYFDLLDAEGRDSWGRPNSKGNGSLAAIRASTGGEHAERLALGQSWDICESIGFYLESGTGLRIGRTSSQDPGVARASDVIVASASLDVGFNDPTVGAVLQHKAPRSAAQFLQRKGRAGRLRGMRPWTVVVLSDYGRDRLAYQGYDLLFDPSIEVQSLPTQNTYVLRIQAAFALMDWLASKLPQHLRGSVWLDLAGPRERNQPRSEHALERQRLELEFIEGALSDESIRSDLLNFVRRALRINQEQLDVVAWEAPRSLLLHVLPTLRRRLASGWSSDGVLGADYQVRWQPMPEFVPSNLFSDLNLPETRIQFPSAQRDADETEAQSPVLQALRTFAPGRVSRRYGIEHRFVRHWVPVPLDQRTTEVDLAAFVEGTDLGTFTFATGTGTVSYQGVRPRSIRTEQPPRRLLDSTNATLEWRSRFEALDDGDEAGIPTPSAWDELVRNVTFHLHARRSGVDLTRLAVASHATLAFEGGLQSIVDATFTVDGHQGALGFTIDVDAIRLDIDVPRFFGPDGRYQADPESMRAFRASYFHHLVETDLELLAAANPFQLQWLSQLYSSVVVERALSDQIDLQEAHRALLSASIGDALHRVLNVIFQAVPNPPEGDVLAEEQEVEGPRQRLHEALATLSADPSVVRRLGQLAAVLWNEPDEGWQRWAASRFASTLGAAVLEGADRMSREVGAQNLVLDTETDHENATCRIWLSEPTIGGGGIVEELARRYSDDPRRFFRLVESALGPSDFEIVDSELVRSLHLAMTDPDVSRQLLDVRSAASQADLTAAVRHLFAGLAERGVAVSHPVTAALHARVLRPGSSSLTDSLLHGLAIRWRTEEERLGIEIDARVFAFISSASNEIDRAVPPPPGEVGDRRQWRFMTINGLLWPRGSTVRASSLRAYNPYYPHPPTDRTLVLTALQTTTPEVSMGDVSWRDKLSEALLVEGTALLRGSPVQVRDLRRAIIEVQAIAIDAGYLMLYPRVIGFARDRGDSLIRLELREAYQ